MLLTVIEVRIYKESMRKTPHLNTLKIMLYLKHNHVSAGLHVLSDFEVFL